MQKKLIIKDCMKHDSCAWPITKVSYPVVFDCGVEAGNWELKDAQGEAIPFQVTDIVKAEGMVTSLTLHFLTSLLKGEYKEYTFAAGEENGKPIEDKAFSPLFGFAVDKEHNSFSVTYEDKKMVCRTGFQNIEYRILNTGSIFEEIEITCRGTLEQEYRMIVRRITGMPFWELEETMTGMETGEAAQMEMTFENFDFTHRYSNARPVEKIDQYLGEKNELPITMMPFENWVPWFQSKQIAFLGEEYSAGVFIRDNLGWDDGKYAIWGSNRDFGVTFRYEKDAVTAQFPLKNGTRFTGIAAYPGSDSTYVEKLWKWYAFLHLDKVKNWALDWEEDPSRYPKFWGNVLESQECELPKNCSKNALLESLCREVSNVDKMGPVSNRIFANLTAVFDLTAKDMSKEEFDRARAMFAFMGYATKDENYMPMENMLAGHPNFMGDTAAVSGFVCALFDQHPEKEMFRKYFNRAVELNMKYHIRPDVAAYESLGGRETENLSCYSFAMLRPFMQVCSLFERCGYPNPLVCENGAKWLNWMTGALSAPVNGRRIVPQQGAHSRTDDIPYMLCQLAQMLEDTYPEIARNTYAACRGSALNGFEHNEKVWKLLFERKEDDGELTLKTEKFTGFGCILREGVGTPNEISVHVQQLDRGPNYRWGCFENTGNGGIYYYAAGKRYSYNSPEDTGDRDLGADVGNCGFAVKKDHFYHNIGFQDLTEPLRDFPVVKQAKLMAGDTIRDYYKYRRVSLVETDYAVMYDAVTHMRAAGRFLWTVNELEEFPEIWQLVPGAKQMEGDGGANQYRAGNGDAHCLEAHQRSKTVTYDGNGNFLTLVSHRKDIQVQKTEYGAAVELPDRTDYLFEDEARIRYQAEAMSFTGKSGIISIHKDGTVRGALLEGTRIGVGNLQICLEGRGAVFFEKQEMAKAAGGVDVHSADEDVQAAGAEGTAAAGIWSGLITADEFCSLRINDRTVLVEKGKYRWKLGADIELRKLPERTYTGINGFVRDTRRHEWGFLGTDFKDTGEILTYPEE